MIILRNSGNDPDEGDHAGAGPSPTDSRKPKDVVEWNGLAEKSDAVDRSIQDKLQKLRKLSSSKKGQMGIERVQLDKERGYFGTEIEPVDADSKSKTENVNKPSSVVKSRQPLLSKRSKKQLKNLGNEERSLSQEDLSGKLEILLYYLVTLSCFSYFKAYGVFFFSSP